MKSKIVSILFLLSFFVFGQEKLCHSDIMIDEELNVENKIKDYLPYDFSDLWLQTDDQNIYGIIGDDYQRILIKILVISKNLSQPNEYYVYGKSMVDSNICEFVGRISIIKIQESDNQNFGVDYEYQGKSEKQGLLTAKYEFFEDKNKMHSGTFQGTLETKWYLKDGKIHYNDLGLVSDGYFNNAFVGNWRMYNSKLEKICNWGDYRVPNVNCDFDIGTAEFNVAEKYMGQGWVDIALKNMVPNGAIIRNKSNEPIKNWWE